MILVDAGPLVALMDADEHGHLRCAAALRRLEGPMVTTWPAFGEAMYLLGDRGGWPMQAALWRLVERSDLTLGEVDIGMQARCRQLMETYRDLPMDLADATLVALAESLRVWRVFTLDSHFRIYRPHGHTSFQVIPEEE